MQQWLHLERCFGHATIIGLPITKVDLKDDSNGGL